MDSKDAMMAELALIPGYIGKIDPADMFWQMRERDEATIAPANKDKIQIVFQKVSGDQRQRVRNQGDRFEFHFIGKNALDQKLEIAKDILVQYFESFSGKLGGPSSPIVVHAVRYETEGESYDDELGEKTIFVQMSFNYIHPPHGTL